VNKIEIKNRNLKNTNNVSGVIEGIKTFFIWTLLLCAIIMASKLWLGTVVTVKVTDSEFMVMLAELLDFQIEEDESNLPIIADFDYNEACTPSQIMITRAEGKYGTIGNTYAIYDRIRATLGEAIGSVLSVVEIEERIWEEELLGNSVYLKYDQPVNIEYLEKWYGNIEEHAKLTGLTNKILISERNDMKAALYYYDCAEDKYYGCATLVTYSAIVDELSGYEPNGAHFALEGNYKNLKPETIILSDAVSYAMAKEDWSVYTEEKFTQVMLAFGFNPQSNYLMTESDGSRIAINGECVLKISSDGTMIYNGTQNDKLSILNKGESVTPLSIVEQAQKLADNTVGIMCGDAKLRLISVDKVNEEYVLLYKYIINDIEVEIEGYDYAVCITANDEYITGMLAHIRHYEMTEGTAAVMPIRVAGVIAQSDDIALCYVDDSTGLLLPAWIEKEVTYAVE